MQDFRITPYINNIKHTAFVQRKQKAEQYYTHCQKLGTRWRLRVRTKATMAANSYKKMYGDNETFSNISIISSRVFGARLETC